MDWISKAYRLYDKQAWFDEYNFRKCINKYYPRDTGSTIQKIENIMKINWLTHDDFNRLKVIVWMIENNKTVLKS